MFFMLLFFNASELRKWDTIQQLMTSHGRCLHNLTINLFYCCSVSIIVIFAVFCIILPD